MQDPRNVWRRELNGETGFVGVAASVKIAALFPDRVPARFNVGRLEALGKFVGVRLSHFYL